jgi:hypothetical protein
MGAAILSLTGINQSLYSLIHVQNFIRYPLTHSAYLPGAGVANALLEVCDVLKIQAPLPVRKFFKCALFFKIPAHQFKKYQ